ncbi:TPA: hypothetical protein ACGO8I_001566 [Streptococcus suis]
MENKLLCFVVILSVVLIFLINTQTHNRRKITKIINDFKIDYKNNSQVIEKIISNKNKLAKLFSVCLSKLLLVIVYVITVSIILIYELLANVIINKKYIGFVNITYKYIIFPFLLTFIFVRITEGQQSPSILIIRTYYQELLNNLNLESIQQFFIINFAIFLFFCLFKYLESNSKNQSDVIFSQFFILSFGSIIAAFTLIVFIATYFIFSDDVAKMINSEAVIVPVLDVYSTVAIYYSSCILISQLTYKICIEPIAEKLSQPPKRRGLRRIRRINRIKRKRT